SEMKVDLQPVQQPQPARASVPDPNMDGPPKDVQNIEESMATPSMKQEGNVRDETPRNLSNQTATTIVLGTSIPNYIFTQYPLGPRQNIGKSN
uniref:Uncharacterized protein n=1 Tax=Aegilops tauschii subsp. strangulata TaxID=200361 RepID=A0A453A683_AEGTS